MTGKLRPCPFCSGSPKDMHSNGWGWIECAACGAKGPAERIGHGGAHDDVWNARPVEDALYEALSEIQFKLGDAMPPYCHKMMCAALALARGETEKSDG